MKGKETQMMIIPAAVSASVADYASGNRTGFVHSVYRNTVNLSLNERFIALQSGASPKSAMSVLLPLNTEEMSLMGVSAGGLCEIRDGILFLIIPESRSGAVCIPLRADFLPPSCIFPVTVPELPREAARFVHESALAMLNGADGFAGIFSGSKYKDDPVLSYAGGILDNTRSLLAAKDTGNTAENAAAELRRLIGLGGGLTPSGDDFLCGALAALLSFGMWKEAFAEKLREEIFRHLEDTNAISAAFLRSSLQGECSEAVRMLFQGHFPLSPTEYEKIRNAFYEIGHSSGTDSLCGICYISCLIWEELL